MQATISISFFQGRTYALTLLSCNVVEYRVKSEAAGELDHARSLIRNLREQRTPRTPVRRSYCTGSVQRSKRRATKGRWARSYSQRIQI
jgi:hypothetical protein